MYPLGLDTYFTVYRISKILLDSLASMLSTPKPVASLARGKRFLSIVLPDLQLTLYHSFVEFETANDLKTAVEKLDGREFKGARVTCTQDVGSPSGVTPERTAFNFYDQVQPIDDRPARDPYRSRSPMRRYPGYDDYDRRGPPRGYSPRTHYRERSPPPRRDYYERDPYGRRSPPPPPPRSRYDDYPPPRRPYDDQYDFRGPPPRHFDDPYAPPARPYAGGRPTRSPPPPRGEYAGYDRRPYW